MQKYAEFSTCPKFESTKANVCCTVVELVSLTATMVFSIARYEMNVAIVLGGGGLSQACVRSAKTLNF